MKKRYFLVIDTETCMDGQVFDFGAIVTDKQGNIQAECGIIIRENQHKELFFNRDGGFFSINNLRKRHQHYKILIDNGSRLVRSTESLNLWLHKVKEKFNPELTAYNLDFDVSTCFNTGIKLSFNKRFCLWHLACNQFSNRKGFTEFCLKNKLLTPKQNLKTNAEVMFNYLYGKNDIEPHTALEDIKDFELPILLYILRQKKRFDLSRYDWRNYQLLNRLETLGLTI